MHNTAQTLDEVLERLALCESDLKISICQDYLKNIKDSVRRESEERHLLIAGSLVNRTFPDHFIVLIHGIRTNGAWQSKLAAKLASHKNVRAISVGYGYFDLIRFLIPIWTRRKPVDKVLQQLRYLRAEHPTALISVVAHSFGSYIIAAILDYASDVRLHRLLLCGSVVRDSFRWDRAKPYVKGDIVNDVGTRDFYPIAAKSFSWGFGATGTLGFQTAAIHDRYFNCGHSDFFTDDHMESYWLPQLVDGKIVPSDWSSQRPPLSRYAVALMLIPFKWIFVALFVVALYVLLNQFGILSSA